MNGIELSRAFYEQFGKAMLREKFPHLKDKIAVGIAGSGSDCYGYDDDISRDHDYEAGFCIFLPGEDVVSRRDEFLLERLKEMNSEAWGEHKKRIRIQSEEAETKLLVPMILMLTVILMIILTPAMLTMNL